LASKQWVEEKLKKLSRQAQKTSQQASVLPAIKSLIFNYMKIPKGDEIL